jgi:hypothetical protein
MLDDDFCPRRSDNILIRELDDGTVLHDEKTSQVYTLNTTAALIWECCDGKTPIREMVKELTGVSDMKPDELLQDVRGIVQDFQKKGLLQEEPEHP